MFGVREELVLHAMIVIIIISTELLVSFVTSLPKKRDQMLELKRGPSVDIIMKKFELV